LKAISYANGTGFFIFFFFFSSFFFRLGDCSYSLQQGPRRARLRGGAPLPHSHNALVLG
jgi:hypothetical protein